MSDVKFVAVILIGVLVAIGLVVGILIGASVFEFKPGRNALMSNISKV